jgi:hypothetical protein
MVACSRVVVGVDEALQLGVDAIEMLLISRLTSEFTSGQIVPRMDATGQFPAIKRSDASNLARYPKMTESLVRQQESVVNVPKSVQPFWDKFQASIAYDASPLFYEAFHFDDNEPSANALAALVLSGEKRATAGLLWTNERTNKPSQKLAPSAW